MERSIDTQSLMTLKFESLSPQDQLTRFLSVANNYWETVQGRIERSNIRGAALTVAKFRALSEISTRASMLKGDFVDDMIFRTGCVTSEDLQATSELNGLGWLVGKLRFTARMSPYWLPIDTISATCDQIKHQQFDLTIEAAQMMLDFFPKLDEFMQENRRAHPYYIFTEYRRARRLKGPHNCLDLLIYFLRDLEIMEQYAGTDLAERCFREANLRKYPLMGRVFEDGLILKEQKAVRSIVGYGTGFDCIRSHRVGSLINSLTH